MTRVVKVESKRGIRKRRSTEQPEQPGYRHGAHSGAAVWAARASCRRCADQPGHTRGRAGPLPTRVLSGGPLAQELTEVYTPKAEELVFIHARARGPSPTLTVAVLLKSVQRLGYLPRLQDVPFAVITHIRSCLRLPPTTALDVGPRSAHIAEPANRSRARKFARSLATRPSDAWSLLMSRTTAMTTNAVSPASTDVE